MRISPSGATAAATARRDRSRDGSSTGGSATRPEPPVRGANGAPYVEDVATVASDLAVDCPVLFKACVAVGERGSRRSLPTPGAVGPLAVGMSSTYWATDDASGAGGLPCAPAAPAQLAATTAKVKVTALPRIRGGRHHSLRESTRSTTE
jgi:hypothetical protein